MGKISNNPKQLDTTFFTSEILEDRFSFIKDPVLRQNIILYAKYMLMLYSLGEEYALPSEEKYTNNKIIIVIVSQIVEAVIHYYVKTSLKKGSIQEICLGEEWKALPGSKRMELGTAMNGMIAQSLSKNSAEWSAISSLKVTTQIEQKQTKDFQVNIQFRDLINILSRAKTDKRIIETCRSLQRKRNKIHIGGLETVDAIYKDEEVNKSFDDLAFIINHIRDST